MITLFTLLVLVTLAFLLLVLLPLLKYKRIQVEVVPVHPKQSLPPKQKSLFDQEKALRRIAFSKVDMEKSESFFHDEDMNETYYLTVVKDAKTNEPLLSSRHFFTRSIILEALKTDENNAREWMTLNLSEYAEDEVLLADRLAGNTDDPFYQKNRALIFSQYYWKMIKLNPGKTLILFARSEPKEPLLAKYIRIGFQLVGCVTHNNIPHWVITTELSKSKKFIKSMSKRFLLLRILGWIKSL